MSSYDFEALEPRLLLDAAAAVTFNESQADVTPDPTNGDTATRPATEDTSFALTGVTVEDGGNGDTYELVLTETSGTATDTTLSLSGGPGQSTLTLTGTASEINNQLALVTVTPGANKTGDISISLVLNEGGTERDRGTFIAPITPVNDDPTLAGTDDTFRAAEGGFVDFSLAAIGLDDIDVASEDQSYEQLIIQIDSLPTDGKLTFNGAPVAEGSTLDAANLAKLKYTHSGNDVQVGASDSFNVTVFDGAGGQVSSALTVHLDPVNQAPAIDGAPTQYEGENTGLGLGYSDNESGHADAPANVNVEVTDITGLANRGTLYLDSNNNGTIDAGEAITAPSDASASFTADKLNLLSFAHDGDEPEAIAPSFTIRVTDNGGGEGDIGKLTTTRTVDITILANNDDPVATVNPAPLDATGNLTPLITTTHLDAVDPDSADTQLVYSLVSEPTFGEIQVFQNSEWFSLPISATFTQDDVNNNRVRYVQTSGAGGATQDTGLTFKLADSEYKAFENAGDAGKWRDGAGNEQTGTLTFTVDETFGSGAANSVDPNVNGSVTNNGRANFDEGSTVTLKSTELQYVLTTATGGYTFPAEQVVYSVSNPPSNGTLFLNGNVIGAYDSFTQADIDNSRVTYTHDGGETHKDSFTFIVTNGGTYESRGNVFELTSVQINDTPTAGNSSVSVGERTELRDGTVRLGMGDLAMADADGPKQALNENSDDWADPNGEAGIDALWFQVTGLPVDGELQRWDGTNWVAMTANEGWYSQDLLSLTADGGTSGLRYVHGGDDAPANLTDTFTFEVRDDLAAPTDPKVKDATTPAAGNRSGTGTVTMEVVPFNDAPIISTNKDAADTTITDNAGLTQTTANNLLTVVEGGTGAITTTLLKAVDSDNNTVQATFKVTQAVTNGKLLVDGKVMQLGSTFTQQDIDLGKLSYEHDGSETRADSFQFTVSDGPLTSALGTFDIVVTAANDAPEATATDPASPLIGNTLTGYGTVFTISDADILDGIEAGEQDFVSVEVSLLSQTVTPVGGEIQVNGTSGATISGNGTNTVTVSGTLANVRTELASLQARITGDPNERATLSLTIDDRNGGTPNGGTTNEGGDPINDANNSQTVTVDLVASSVNDAPTGTSNNQTMNEDVPTLLTGLSVQDPDSFDENITVTLTVSDGTLSATGSGVTISGNDTGVVTLVGKVGDVDAALSQVTYTSPQDNNATGSATLDVNIQDTDLHGNGTAQSVDLTQRTLTITAVNDGPTVTAPAEVTMASGTSVQIGGVSVSDDADQGKVSFIDNQTVTITVLSGPGDATGTVSTTSNAAATEITFTGTLANINTELQSLEFAPGNPNNDATARLRIVFDDLGNGDDVNDAGTKLTDNSIIQVNISGTNDNPVITGPATDSVSEDGTFSLSGYQIADPDDFGNSGMSLTLTAVAGTFTSATGVLSNFGRTLTLTNATEAQLNDLLTNASYSPDADFHGTDTLTIDVNDGGNTGTGGALTDSLAVTLTVGAVNDRPETQLTQVSLADVAEDTANPAGQTLSSLMGSAYSDATDDQRATTGGSDSSTGLTFVAITGNAATADQGVWQLNLGAGWVDVPATLNDGQALIVQATRDIRFVPAADFNGDPGQLTVRLGDNSQPTLAESTSGSDTKVLTANGNLGDQTGVWSDGTVSVRISITAVNDAPTTPNASVTLASVAEDTTAPGGATVQNLMAANFSDNADDQTQEAVTNGSSADSFGGIAIVANNADPATEGQWQYSTGAGWTNVPADASVASALILAPTAELRFVPAENFQGSPAGLDYVVSEADQTGANGSRGDVTFSDTGTWSDSASAATLGTAIDARNDAPVLSGTVANSANPATATEQAGEGNGSDTINLVSNASLTDIDSSYAGDDFGGGSITVSLANATAADVFAVTDTLPGVGSTTPGDGSLTVALSSGATRAQVEAILNSLTYRNTSDAPDESTRAFDIVVNDGNNNGNAGGPAALDSNTLTGYLTVTNTDDATTTSLDTGDSNSDNVVDGGPLTASGTVSVTDLDRPDVVNASVASVTTTGNAGGINNATLLAMLGVNDTPVIDSNNTNGDLSWSFNGSATGFEHLAAGETLTLDYVVELDDGNGAPNQQPISVTVTGSNDTPVITVEGTDSTSASVDEANANLTATGTLTVSDPDTSNTVTPSVESVVASGQLTGLALTNGQLQALLSVDNGDVIDNTANTGTLTWDFSSSNEAFNYLAKGESLVLTYTVRATDSDGTPASDDQTVTITIIGSNDAPDITKGTGDNDAATVIEAGTGLSANGSLSVEDKDLSNSVSPSVAGVAASGDTTGLALSDAALQAMMTVNAGAIIDGTGTNGALNWTFDSGSEAFDYLADGESLVLEYTLRATDSDNGTDDHTVTVTINGTNDTPTVSVDGTDSASAGLSEANGRLTDSGTLSVTDVDTTDVVSASVSNLVTAGDTDGIDPAALQAMLSVTGTVIASGDEAGQLTWTFDSNGQAFNHLADTESLVLTYTVTVADGNGGSADQQVQITVNGSNDSPTIAVIGTDSAASTLTEANGGLTDAGTLTVTDRDTSNTVSPSVVGVTAGGNTNGLSVDNATLAGMLSVNGGTIIDGASTQGTLNWTFSSGSEAFSYLAAGESLVLTYTVRATDSSSTPTSDDQTVTVTINGTNDDPVISTDAGDSNAEALTETNDPLQVAGTLSVGDLDTTNEVLAAVQSVSATGDQSSLSNAALLAMMSVDSASVVASGIEQGTINWAFDSNDEAFNHLAENEVLTLTYTLSATDTNGAEALQVVTLTITGTQDAPIIVSNALPVDFSVSDSETIEPIDASVAFTDSDNGSELNFSADNLPAGLSMDPATGVITGTLDGSASQSGDAGTPGVYTVTLAATDTDGNRGETTVVLNVSNPAPVTVDVAGSVEEDLSTSTRGNLLASNANDQAQSDPDGDPLRIDSVQGTLLNGSPQAIQGEFGTLFVTQNGDWRYQLDNQNAEVQRLEQNQSATDSFIFVVDDGQGGQTEASLDIRIDGQAEAVIRPAAEPQAEPTTPPLAPDRAASPGGEGNALPTRTTFAPSSSLGGSEQSINDLFNGSLSIQPVQLAVNLRDVVARESVEEFSLPAGAFVTSDDGEVEIEATLADGSDLPGYVSFNADSGSFRINRDDAIAAGAEQVDIKVIGRDEAGNEASTSFVIYLLPENDEQQAEQEEEAPSAPPSPDQANTGAPALGDMVKAAGQTGFDQEMSDVLADLMAMLDDTTHV